MMTERGSSGAVVRALDGTRMAGISLIHATSIVLPRAFTKLTCIIHMGYSPRLAQLHQ
jgi:hypothetical protein